MLLLILVRTWFSSLEQADVALQRPYPGQAPSGQRWSVEPVSVRPAGHTGLLTAVSPAPSSWLLPSKSGDES